MSEIIVREHSSRFSLVLGKIKTGSTTFKLVQL
jgi:phosphomevalonate kinase